MLTALLVSILTCCHKLSIRVCVCWHLWVCWHVCPVVLFLWSYIEPESKLNRGGSIHHQMSILSLLIFMLKSHFMNSHLTLIPYPFTSITGRIWGWQREREKRREGWMDSVRKGYTCIKSCPSPLIAEADMSLVICRFCLWQRTEVHTFTITHRHTCVHTHTHTHTGQD